jgi:hypothetical protein
VSRRRVFEELLKEWEGQALQIDGEWGDGRGSWIPEDVAEWRKRYDDAAAEDDPA